jgi:hypothetical protein
MLLSGMIGVPIPIVVVIIMLVMRMVLMLFSRVVGVTVAVVVVVAVVSMVVVSRLAQQCCADIGDRFYVFRLGAEREACAVGGEGLGVQTRPVAAAGGQ